MYDVRAEEECGSDGEPNRPAAVFQDVVEEMVVDQIALQAEGEAARQNKIRTPAESVKPCPVRLLSGRREELHHRGSDGIAGLRGGRLVHGADRGAHEKRDVLEVPEGTVKSRINRGRIELARILQQMGVRPA